MRQVKLNSLRERFFFVRRLLVFVDEHWLFLLGGSVELVLDVLFGIGILLLLLLERGGVRGILGELLGLCLEMLVGLLLLLLLLPHLTTTFDIGCTYILGWSDCGFGMVSLLVGRDWLGNFILEKDLLLDGHLVLGWLVMDLLLLDKTFPFVTMMVMWVGGVLLGVSRVLFLENHLLFGHRIADCLVGKIDLLGIEYLLVLEHCLRLWRMLVWVLLSLFK